MIAHRRGARFGSDPSTYFATFQPAARHASRIGITRARAVLRLFRRPQHGGSASKHAGAK